MGKCRRTGVAALILATLSLTATGCLSSRRHHQSRSKDEGPGCGTCARGTSVLPPAGMHSSTPGTDPKDIKPATYMQDEKGNLILKEGKQPYVGGPAHPVLGSAPPGPMPTELARTSLPPYTVAPPDILVLDALRLIPRPPYNIEPLEVLIINVTDTLPAEPITGQFVVGPDGSVNLGFRYGSVRVAGMTLEQAQSAIKTHLNPVLKMPTVSVALAQFRGVQQIRGQHLIRPDGTITLGTYGAVYVAGLTLGQVKCVIEKHLEEYMTSPQVAVDVLAYNSKFYYVILDGAGAGQQVVRIPITGNETVLDAIAIINGISPVSSKKRMWLSRPSPANAGANQVMPVDWRAITEAGSTATNYQIFPGDRLYVDSDCLYRFDTNLAKVLSPIERILGTTLLGATTVQTIRNIGNNNFNNGGAAILVP